MSKKSIILLIVLNIFCFGREDRKVNNFKVMPSTLVTSHYKMNIIHLCKEEGCVSCNNYLLELYEVKSKTITLAKGKAMHTLGNDGVTPSRFLGYEFQKGVFIYKLLDYSDNLFEIYKGKKLIYSEKAIYYEKLTKSKNTD